jgi:hypothetical protein
MVMIKVLNDVVAAVFVAAVNDVAVVSVVN